MQQYPHHYRVAASAEAEGNVNLASPGLDPILSAPPAEFDGPGDLWSPETLLVAAIADCFILSFRGIAKASRLSWLSMECHVEGRLERSEGTTRFTAYEIKATLYVPGDTNEEKAQRLLQKAEAGCLITNSLSGSTHLSATVVTRS
ncbi:MAG: OsmC family protein [Gammaproteobacteria bacterium]|nr:OsmC family protein [Gammaproteobacteria bacterium]